MMMDYPAPRPSRHQDENGLPDVSPYAFMAPAPWRPVVRTVVKKEKPRLYKEINRRTYNW
jgi:hypothetical protein